MNPKQMVDSLGTFDSINNIAIVRWYLAYWCFSLWLTMLKLIMSYLYVVYNFFVFSLNFPQGGPLWFNWVAMVYNAIWSWAVSIEHSYIIVYSISRKVEYVCFVL